MWCPKNSFRNQYLYGKRDTNNKNNMLFFSYDFSPFLISPSFSWSRIRCLLFEFELLKRSFYAMYCLFAQLATAIGVYVCVSKSCKWCLLNTVSCPKTHARWSGRLLVFLFFWTVIRHDSVVIYLRYMY